MSLYLFLGVASAIFLAEAALLYHRGRSIAFPLGLVLMYHLTLVGAWLLVAENRGFDPVNAGLGYTYLYERLFPVRLDDDYRLALQLYATFLVTIGGVLLLRVRPLTAARANAPPPLPLSHGRLLTVCGAAAAGTFLFFRESIQLALSSGASAYVISRAGENNPAFAIGAILSRAALMPAALGLATLCSGPGARYIVARTTRPWHLLGYVVVIGGMFALAATLGSKNELLTSMITGVLFYLANSPRPRYGILIGLGSVAAVSIGAIELLRASPLALIGSAVNRDTAFLVLTAPFTSNEIFAAHFSMYGALHEHLPLTWGASLENFALSVVPRLFWPDRPPDVYAYYASGVGATEGQGYTIHHATGWYLNFGLPGVVIGAVVLAWIWSSLHNAIAADLPRRLVGRVFTVIAPWTFVAGIPGLIRSGPEGYKGLIINSLLVPTCILVVACAVFRARPVLAPTPSPVLTGAD